MFVNVFLGAGRDGLLTPKSGRQEAIVKLFHAHAGCGAVAAVTTWIGFKKDFERPYG